MGTALRDCNCRAIRRRCAIASKTATETEKRLLELLLGTVDGKAPRVGPCYTWCLFDAVRERARLDRDAQRDVPCDNGVRVQPKTKLASSRMPVGFV